MYHNGSVAELWYQPEADEALRRLESDPTRPQLLAAANRVLDQLETDPGAEWVRRHRFVDPALWGVVISGEEEWALLWSSIQGEVTVEYLGPASFT
jgi:hypothetical protein